MYTEEMKRAFHNIIPPKNFGVTVIDNDHFLTIKLNGRLFEPMTYEEKIEALKYVNTVKDAFEQNGAIVLVTREAIND